ncbi:MAG: beta-propeller domain-containing protein [Mycobacteriales bacterium]|nr:beta-propeller domain-containing protein [Mycobacteriales bacterium]
MRTLTRTLVSAGVVGSATAALVVALPGATPPAAAAGLTPYASCDALLAHYRGALRDTATPYGWGWGGGMRLFGGERAVAAMPSTASGTAADSGAMKATGPGATGTNLQEEGVDEPDSAKVVGDLLVVVARGSLQLLRAGDAPTQLSSLALGLQDGYGAEVLVSGDRALVLVNGWRQDPQPVAASTAAPMGRGWWGGGTALTRGVLVDIADPTAPTLLERLELEGRYLSARLVDGRVRLVTSSTAQPTSGAQPQADSEKARDEALSANRKAAAEVTLGDVLPRLVRRGPDGGVRADTPAVGCGAVSHAEQPRGASTLLVTTLDPATGLAPVDSDGVTTDGDLVYASTDRLYVATSRWGTVAPAGDDTAGTTADTTTAEEAVTTEIHAFDTSTATTGYVGTGSVSGYVLGRWAFSEHEGRLRVATTSAPPWQQGQEQSVSTMSVLEESAGELAVVGRVSGMGKGERIQAVRFFGDLATVVTFRQTDPLYVLDLSDPVAPRLLGELKVPGFSTYLHPLGGDLLLGLGMDADEKTGRTTGMQLSVFDLSDRSAPRQVDRLSLGEGWSQALDDSRAFGYDPQRRLALLPFMQYRDQQASALGVRIGADGTLTEAGRLEVHPSTPTTRVLHDADRVYAVSESGIAAGRSTDLDRTGAVTFPR